MNPLADKREIIMIRVTFQTADSMIEVIAKENYDDLRLVWKSRVWWLHEVGMF